MNELIIDSVKFRENVSKFSDCVDIYNQSVNEFFNLIAKTNAWVGNSAEAFITKCSSEKLNYLDYGEYLVKVRNALQDISESLDATIKTSGGQENDTY